MPLDLLTAVQIQILAKTDALFLPVRHRAGDSRERLVAAYFGRKEFERVGVPWASRARSEAGRKRSQRALEQLARDGVVQCFRSGGRVTHVRLASEAEEPLRRLCIAGSEYSAFLSM